MNDDAKNNDTSALPLVVDRDTWQADVAALRVREKAHTREGDSIAAARRRLPMVEVDAGLELIGPNGPVTLLDAFEGRRQWSRIHAGHSDDLGTAETGTAPMPHNCH